MVACLPRRAVTPEAGVRYTREMLEQSPVGTAALAGAPSSTFRVEGVELSRDQVAPSAGVRVGIGENVDVALTYSADVRGENVGHIGSAALRVRW